MPSIDTLPQPEQITNKPIATAAKALRDAQKAADEARKTRVQLEIELPNAKDADAAADEKLRAEGKAPLKGRPATATAEKAIEDAQHEELVCGKAIIRAEGDLQAADDEHGSTYAAERAKRVTDAAAAFQTALSKLVTTFGEYGAATRVAIQLGDDELGVQTAKLTRAQLQGIELPKGAATSWDVYAEDLLGALGELGKPQPEVEQRDPRAVAAGPNVSGPLKTVDNSAGNPDIQEFYRRLEEANSHTATELEEAQTPVEA